jgi:hypothetical protein
MNGLNVKRVIYSFRDYWANGTEICDLKLRNLKNFALSFVRYGAREWEINGMSLEAHFLLLVALKRLKMGDIKQIYM